VDRRPQVLRTPDERATLGPRKSIEETLANDVARIAGLDVRVTRALLELGRDVAIGRLSPQVIDARWKARRTRPDLPGSLAAAADADRLDGWLDTVRPVHPEYAALQQVPAGIRDNSGEDGDARARSSTSNSCSRIHTTSTCTTRPPTACSRAAAVPSAMAASV